MKRYLILIFSHRLRPSPTQFFKVILSLLPSEFVVSAQSRPSASPRPVSVQALNPFPPLPLCENRISNRRRRRSMAPFHLPSPACISLRLKEEEEEGLLCPTRCESVRTCTCFIEAKLGGNWVVLCNRAGGGSSSLSPPIDFLTPPPPTPTHPLCLAVLSLSPSLAGCPSKAVPTSLLLCWPHFYRPSLLPVLLRGWEPPLLAASRPRLARRGGGGGLTLTAAAPDAAVRSLSECAYVRRRSRNPRRSSERPSSSQNKNESEKNGRKSHTRRRITRLMSRSPFVNAAGEKAGISLVDAF